MFFADDASSWRSATARSIFEFSLSTSVGIAGNCSAIDGLCKRSVRLSAIGLAPPVSSRYQPAKEFNMNRCIRYLPIAIFLLSATTGESGDRQQNSDIKREVWEALENYETAFMKRDVTALEKIWADDSVFLTASGEVLTKEQNLANIKSGATELETMIEQDGMMVRVYQNSAVTTSPVTIKGQYSGQHVNGLYRSTLFWEKVPLAGN
jgi:ketosteroid isomerase-like protein